MRLFRFGLVLAWLGVTQGALADKIAPPAIEPAAPPAATLEAPAAATLEAPAPSQPTEPPSAEPPPSESPSPPPESAPAPEKTPESAPAPEAPAPESPAPERAEAWPAPPQRAPAEPPSLRAHWPLTLEGRLGFLVRPDSGAGFDHESNVGAEVGLSLYLQLKRELAAGIEIERSSLGRGTALSHLDSVGIDYTVSSAMLGIRAFPKRSELFDLYVGLQVGVGIQGVSAAGTANNGPLSPARAYSCSGSDAPAFQLGGGVGARLMLSPRWGLSTRINATGRRLSDELVGTCAPGIGTATTLSAGLGLGYDFDLDGGA
jgi:hypothetical protein